MMLNGTQHVREANEYGHSVRLFGMGKCQSFEPAEEPAAASPGWARASNVTVGQGWGHLSAICYLYGLQIYRETGVPIGLIEADVGGVTLATLAPPDALLHCGVKPLNKSTQAAEMWKTECSGYDGGVAPTNHSMCCTNPPDFVVPPTPRASAPSSLWHAMIYPFTTTVIKGAIWFQGESDSSPAGSKLYNCTFPAMIKSWRSMWHHNTAGATDPLFPFGFVQLGAVGCTCNAGQSRSMCNCPGNDPRTGPDFMGLRWSQTASTGRIPNAAMPNTFTAVSYDLPDEVSAWGTVHFRAKTPVAMRLAQAGLVAAYGKKGYGHGPVIVSVDMLADTGNDLAIVLFAADGPPIEKPLRSPNGFQLGYMDLADSVIKWINVTAAAKDLRSATLSLDVMPTGVSRANLLFVRYNWAVSPCYFQQCAVYGGTPDTADMPAGPYIGTVSRKAFDVSDDPTVDSATKVLSSFIHQKQSRVEQQAAQRSFRSFLSNPRFFGPFAEPSYTRSHDLPRASATVAEMPSSPESKVVSNGTAPTPPIRYQIRAQYHRKCSAAAVASTERHICAFYTILDFDLSNSSLGLRGTSPWGYRNLKTVNETTHIFDYSVSCSRQLQLQPVVPVPPVKNMRSCGTEVLNGVIADRYCYVGRSRPLVSAMLTGQMNETIGNTSETVWYEKGTNRPLQYVSAQAASSGIVGGLFTFTHFREGLENGAVMIPAVWCPPCEQMPPIEGIVGPG